MTRKTRLFTGQADIAAGMAPAIRRPTSPAPTVVTNFQTGHGFTATNVSSSNMNDTTDFVTGTQSAFGVSQGTGAQTYISRSNFGTFDLTGKVIRVLLKVTNLAHMNTLRILLGNTNFTSFYLQDLQGSLAQPGDYVEEGKWMWVSIPWNPQPNGTPNRAAITDMRIAWFDDATGQLVKVQVDSIQIVPATHAAFPNGVITLTFDDFPVAQYTIARAKMDQYGYAGTAYGILDRLDTAGNLTTAQLRNLERINNWEIAAHARTSDSHNRSGGFTSLTAGQLDEEMIAVKSWLNVNGFKGADHYAYPQGLYNQTVLDAVSRYHRTGRLISAPRANELLPPVDYLKLRAWSANNDVPAMQGVIDAAKAQGSWGIITFHDIVTGTVSTPGTQTSQTNFNTMIDYINTQGVPVRTMTEVLNAL